MKIKKELSSEEQNQLIETLKDRFEKHKNRHKSISWVHVEEKLRSNPEKLWSLNQMENTAGEPDVVDYDQAANEYVFYDCSAESPEGRRSICFDPEALEARKKFKPKDSAMGMATAMGVELLNETQYRALQKLGNFDQKTSSWIETPEEIRKLGGSLFADFRFNTVFIYHNGAESYYAGRGFRGSLRV
ncbi:uncharacterized protein DUF4256 [Mariniflexile fucanivorans]|uniref:Uncharacterized protein DUF4256 n=1 Tax=Mariniflexile fucanivorans TaxID=264023 RepID=A0A4R1RGG0_9FLAO|nr:DUF4256 domain-containing protein [Mariniflexile fucanivorans]TCL65075.1 uncharacterized protein DUF4256 [Mariniflexile fucanivorans]